MISIIKMKRTIDQVTEECSICQDDLAEHTVCMFQCGHHFHSICIFPWLIANQTCPICRRTDIRCQHVTEDTHCIYSDLAKHSTEVLLEVREIQQTTLKSLSPTSSQPLQQTTSKELIMFDIGRQMEIIKYLTTQKQERADMRLARLLTQSDTILFFNLYE